VLRDEVLRALQAAGDTAALRGIERQARTQPEREAVRRVLAGGAGARAPAR
jgi:hypothetical protein